MAYAIYRLPHEDHATMIRQTNGNPVELHSLTELNGIEGFVVAPFEVAPNQPVVVIQGEPRSVECTSRSEEGGVRSENRFTVDSSLQGNLTPHSSLHNIGSTSPITMRNWKTIISEKSSWHGVLMRKLLRTWSLWSSFIVPARCTHDCS